MSRAQGTTLASKFNTFLIDVDGVLWLEGKAIPGAAETVAALRNLGKQIVFLTNKSTGSRREINRRLAQAGLTVPPEELVTSAHAASVYILRHAGPTRVYAIGSCGLKEEIRSAGHTLTERDPAFVVVGFVPLNELSEEMLCCIRKFIHSGAHLIACNRDRGNPLPGGAVSLGSYYTVQAVEQATGACATVVGKPFRPIFDIIFRRFSLVPAECLLVGDSLTSDVRGGKNVGMPTALVMTGLTDPEALRASELQPDYVLPSVADLLQYRA